jgi:hypothetical protein
MELPVSSKLINGATKGTLEAAKGAVGLVVPGSDQKLKE